MKQYRYVQKKSSPKRGLFKGDPGTESEMTFSVTVTPDLFRGQHTQS
jgi:hypothetical protein